VCDCNPKLEPLTVTLTEACRLTGYKETSIYKLIKAKKFKKADNAKLGVNKCLIDYPSLVEYIKGTF
jgi:hypothetical protein